MSYYENLAAAEARVRQAWVALDHALAAQRADIQHFGGRLGEERSAGVRAACEAVSRAKTEEHAARKMPEREDDIRARAQRADPPSPDIPARPDPHSAPTAPGPGGHAVCEAKGMTDAMYLAAEFRVLAHNRETSGLKEALLAQATRDWDIRIDAENAARSFVDRADTYWVECLIWALRALQEEES